MWHVLSCFDGTVMPCPSKWGGIGDLAVLCAVWASNLKNGNSWLEKFKVSRNIPFDDMTGIKSLLWLVNGCHYFTVNISKTVQNRHMVTQKALRRWHIELCHHKLHWRRWILLSLKVDVIRITTIDGINASRACVLCKFLLIFHCNYSCILCRYGYATWSKITIFWYPSSASVAVFSQASQTPGAKLSDIGLKFS